MARAFHIGWDLVKRGYRREDYPELRDDVVAASLYAGGGGDSEGARMAGIPTAYAADGWDTALDVHRANHPEAVHDQVWFGDNENGGSIEDMIQRVNDVIDGRKWHLHGSPPCTFNSAASRKNNFGRRVDEGLEQTNWYLEFVRRALAGDNPPLSWSMENSPRLGSVLDQAEELGMPMAQKIRSMGRNMPILAASGFGVPQTRRRLFIGDNWTAKPTRGKNSPLDILPHLADEEQDIMESGHKPSSLDELIGRKQITEKVRDMMLEKPHLNLTGSVNVGRGGSPWNKEKKGYTWKHTWGADRPIPSLTASNPAAHAWNRVLTPKEAGMLTGFPEDYDWSAAEGKLYDTRTPEGGGTTSPAAHAIIGNSVSPPVARSRYANILPKQSRLMDW